MDLGNYTQPGLEGDAISFSSAQEFVQNLLNKGYVWDGASYNGTNLDATNYAGINFGNYDNTDDKNGISQKWVINLVHGVTPVNPDHPDDKDGFTKDYLDRTITRDVTYVYEDGSQAAAPVHQEAHYQDSGYLDNVTGKWVTVENGKITGLARGLTWTPDQDSTFDQIGAKNIEGYHVSSVSGNGISGFTVGQDGTVGQQTVTKDTPSVQSGYDDGNKNVKEINNITPDSGNVEVTVTYNKNNVPTPVKQGTIEIIYHDTTDNVDIPEYGQSQIKEDEGTSFSYNPNAKDLPALESKGYVPDGKLPTIPTKFTDGDQRVVINVKHGTTTVTPDKPGKPGDPIDPNNPDCPKYPEGTSENNLKVTGTQTIHYIGAGDKTPKDNTQSFEFTKQITFDNVTGKIINDSGWNVTSHTFGSEATPVIDGYHADKTTAGGTTVTPNDLHKTVIVTYTPNVPAVPTPTPSPEPKPENTPVEPNTPTPTPEPENDNVKPHGESIVQKNNNNPKVVSHGQSGNNWTAPHGQRVDQKSNVVTSDNRVVGYVDQNGKAHYTKLPQTGDDQTNDVAAALLGGAAVSLGLIGLAGVKKRRKEDK